MGQGLGLHVSMNGFPEGLIPVLSPGNSVLLLKGQTGMGVQRLCRGGMSLYFAECCMCTYAITDNHIYTRSGFQCGGVISLSLSSLEIGLFNSQEIF